jgi:hypothetical protein
MRKKATVRLWSPYRPERPDIDPLYEELVGMFNSDDRSVWDKANDSGLSTTTIYNWRKGKTKRPSGVSLQMAAAMLGRKIRLD